jgi:para-aminobenzoate synthetase/4-amino-4-deoxychorismate lyase
MVTTVHARLLPGEGAADLVRAIFPCGSVTGAPKICAMELIDTHERDARGLYCGAIGHVDPAGDAVFNVAFAACVWHPIIRGRMAGAPRWGSDRRSLPIPVALGEWRECMIKGNFLQLSAGQADLIETMAFDPAKGIALLEFHLERLRDSASALAFAFDRHAARNAIHALCFDLDAPARVRLVVSRGGAMALETAPLPAPIEGLWSARSCPCRSPPMTGACATRAAIAGSMKQRLPPPGLRARRRCSCATMASSPKAALPMFSSVAATDALSPRVPISAFFPVSCGAA